MKIIIKHGKHYFIISQNNLFFGDYLFLIEKQAKENEKEMALAYHCSLQQPLAQSKNICD